MLIMHKVFEANGVSIRESFSNPITYIAVFPNDVIYHVDKEELGGLIKELMDKEKYPRRTEVYGDIGDSGTDYYGGFSIDDTDDFIKGTIERLYRVDTDGVQIHSEYDCTGEYFSQPLHIERIGGEIIVSQTWGYDI